MFSGGKESKDYRYDVTLEHADGDPAMEIIDASFVLQGPAQPLPLAVAGQAANAAATDHLFAEYRSRIAPQSRRRQDGDLRLFATYLRDAGVLGPLEVPVVAQALALRAEAWAGMTWGLVAGFVRWMLQHGYAVGSINVRLSTIKRYAELAHQAGVVPTEELMKIRTVRGYRVKEGKRLDTARSQQRRSAKKATPVPLTLDQMEQLKQQPDTPQGRRDRVLMCLLLDHGLRVGEVAGLQAEHVDLELGTLQFYRPKVDQTQTHRLSEDTYAALERYLHRDQLAHSGPLLRGSRKDGDLEGQMSSRAINLRVEHLGAQLGIEQLSPHDCRHAWATRAATHGTDPFALQEAGGWSSLAMPRRYVQRAKIANQGVKLKK